ncbi:MAG: DinB family protein [Bacteroidota bacterium]
MITTAISRLTYLCDTIPHLLKAIPEDQFSHKPAPHKWSPKEEIGHLVDSATNNHQRFIRAQFQDTPFIVYAQDEWNNRSRYHDMPSAHIISFWEIYNRHLIEIVKRIPQDALQRKCLTNEPQSVTVEWLIIDYVAHQEHHLGKVVSYQST